MVITQACGFKIGRSVLRKNIFQFSIINSRKKAQNSQKLCFGRSRPDYDRTNWYNTSITCFWRWKCGH